MYTYVYVQTFWNYADMFAHVYIIFARKNAFPIPFSRFSPPFFRGKRVSFLLNCCLIFPTHIRIKCLTKAAKQNSSRDEATWNYFCANITKMKTIRWHLNGSTSHITHTWGEPRGNVPGGVAISGKHKPWIY